MAWNPVSEPPQPIQDLTIRILKGTIDDQEMVEQIAQLLDAPDKENRLGDHYRYRLIEMAGRVPYFPPPGRYLMAAFGKTMPEPTPAQVKASLQNRRLALAKYAKGPFQAGSRYGEINSRYLYLSAGMVGVPIDQQELVNSVKHHSSIPVEMILSAVCAQEKIDPAIRPQLEHYATSEEPLALRVTDPNHNPRNTDPMAQPSKAYPLEQYYPIKELARKALSQMNGNEQAIERLIEPLFDSGKMPGILSSEGSAVDASLRILDPDSQLLTQLTADQLSSLSDAEVALFYYNRVGSHPANSWNSIVDVDIMSRPSSGAILLHFLNVQNRRKNLRGAVWAWLAQHPNYPHGQELLKESIRIFRAEGKALGPNPMMALGYFIAAIGTPEQAQVLDELEQAGAIGIDISKHRYAERIKAASASETKPIGSANDKRAASTSNALLTPSSTKVQASPDLPTDDGFAASNSNLMWGLSIVASIGLLWLLLKRRA